MIKMILIIFAITGVFLIDVSFWNYTPGRRMSITYYMLPLFIALILDIVFFDKGKKFTKRLRKYILYLIVFYVYINFYLVFASRGALVAIFVCLLLCLISKIKNPFNINWGSIGENIIKGIAKGISSAIGWVVNAAKKAAKAAFNAAKSLLGIHSPSTLFRDEIGLNMALGMGIGFEDNIPVQDINSALDNAVNKISGHYAEVGQRINPVDAITGTSRVAETYQADVSNIFEGMTIIVDNTTNLDGTPIYKNAARYTISEIGNQQKAVLKARGAFA